MATGIGKTFLLRRRAVWAAWLILIAGLGGIDLSCSRKPAEPQFPFHRDYKSGPVSFRVSLSDSAVTIAERLEMMLETRAEKGWRAELPKFGEKLSQFGIVDYRNFQPELGDNGIVVTKRLYELEPFLSGEYKIPPMQISFYQDGDSTAHVLESDTIVVRVESLLPKDKASLEINDIAPPASFPFSWRNILIVIGCLAAAGVATFLFIKRRRIREKLIPPLPAHEKAYRRLQELLESGMLDERRYREFTAAVADVLRQYIEDRFGLRAPERTTEEFLVEAGAGLPVPPEQKRILTEFLAYCDLVKFAALEPAADDVKSSFNTSKDFIEATKEREEVKAAAEPAAAPAPGGGAR